MLVGLQFPLSDARAFDPDTGLRLKVPDWPNPTTDIRPQFVHHFGAAVERKRDADQAWPDEFKFCHARRAVRFADLAHCSVGTDAYRFRPACAFRRLFSDGQSVVRVELGLVHNHRSPALVGMDAGAVLAIASDLCNVSSAVPKSTGGATESALIRQGPSLAKLYARSSRGNSTSGSARAESLVEAGNPLLVIELEANEAVFPLIPAGFASVPSDKTSGANLAFGRLRTPAGVVATWILQRGQATYEQARGLRLCLMRLHAEQECLDLILKQIRRGNLLNPADESAVNDLDAYFKQRIRLVDRKEWSGVGQSAILEAVDAADMVTPAATRQNLADRYDGARRQIWQKVEAYQLRRAAIRVVNVVNTHNGDILVDKSVTITQTGTGNIANVAEFMSNVTNNVNNNLDKSAAGEDVKALIKQLTQQITDIAPKADPKQTQRMGGDLQSLSTELAQPEPRRKWYELSLSGLKEAAEAVGAIAAPIAATVAKLTPLLLGA